MLISSVGTRPLLVSYLNLQAPWSTSCVSGLRFLGVFRRRIVASSTYTGWAIQTPRPCRCPTRLGLQVSPPASPAQTPWLVKAATETEACRVFHVLWGPLAAQERSLRVSFNEPHGQAGLTRSILCVRPSQGHKEAFPQRHLLRLSCFLHPCKKEKRHQGPEQFLLKGQLSPLLNYPISTIFLLKRGVGVRWGWRKGSTSPLARKKAQEVSRWKKRQRSREKGL